MSKGHGCVIEFKGCRAIISPMVAFILVLFTFTSSVFAQDQCSQVFERSTEQVTKNFTSDQILVPLDLSFENRQFNHIELFQMVRSQNRFVQKLGFSATASPDIVAAPSREFLNRTLTEIASQRGFSSPAIQYYEARDIVLDEEYLRALADGKFPYDSSAPSLSAHDALHGVAFAMLETSQYGHQLLQVASSRARVLIRIIDRVRDEATNPSKIRILRELVDFKGKEIIGDAFERTMLLAMSQMGTTDYDAVLTAYQSFWNGTLVAQKIAQRENVISSVQKQLRSHPSFLKARIQEILRHINFGNLNFRQLKYDLQKRYKLESSDLILRIIDEERLGLSQMDDSQLKMLSEEIMKTIPPSSLDSSKSPSGKVQIGDGEFLISTPEPKL